MDGILPLWKPKGLTSHDCVNRVRRLFKTRKVGHTGTLDPEVEGVLAICIGRATKIVPFLTAAKKTYIAECQLGIATETEDAYGKVIETKDVVQPPTEDEINRVLSLFKGEITQIPPMYSAVKVKGKRLYEYARANEPVERPSRQVTIYHIEQLPSDGQDPTVFRMKVVCSQGTYIRTLCVDIGKKLGYPAHMSDLKRIEAGSFTEADTVTFEEIEKAVELGEQQNLLYPMIRGLQHLDHIQIDYHTKTRALHGQKLKKPKTDLKTDPFVLLHDEQLIAIYETDSKDPTWMKPVRVFSDT